jgi:glycerol-3-phosphate cytidylyltransferase
MINIYVVGVFDLYHRGHVELLKNAKNLGDRLIVAINGDNIVSKYKRLPFFSEEDRLFIVKSCKYVDDAFIIDSFDNKEAILKYEINVIVHGDDWVGNSYLQQIGVTPEFLQTHNIELKFLPYTKGISTSDLIKKISVV